MKKERIGLFGGTFNPIHLGHLKAAGIVRDRFLMDKVFFIPSFIPPHKKSDEVAAPEHRLHMVRLALHENSQFIPSSIEIDAGGESYSVITLAKIRKSYSQALVFFILGIDAFLEIETWKDYREVLKNCFFIIISRPGYSLQEAREVLGGRYREKMREVFEKDDISRGMLSQYMFFLFPLDALDVSSTEIRKRLKKGESLEGMVPSSVENYIKENKLYT